MKMEGIKQVCQSTYVCLPSRRPRLTFVKTNVLFTYTACYYYIKKEKNNNKTTKLKNPITISNFLNLRICRTGLRRKYKINFSGRSLLFYYLPFTFSLLLTLSVSPLSCHHQHDTKCIRQLSDFYTFYLITM